MVLFTSHRTAVRITMQFGFCQLGGVEVGQRGRQDLQWAQLAPHTGHGGATPALHLSMCALSQIYPDAVSHQHASHCVCTLQMCVPPMYT
jgi:hypothetical protein